MHRFPILQNLNFLKPHQKYPNSTQSTKKNQRDAYLEQRLIGASLNQTLHFRFGSDEITDGHQRRRNDENNR